MMVWIDIIFGSLVYLSAVAFAVLTIGTIAVRLTSQPIERIRIIQLTLLTVFSAAALGQVSIMPRWNLGLLDYSDRTTQPNSHADLAMDSRDSGPLNIDAMAIDDPYFTGELLDASEKTTEKRDVIEPVVVSNTSDFWSNAAWPNLQEGAGLLCVLTFALAILFFAIESFVGMLRLRQITRAATRAPAALTALWQSASGEHGQNVRLLVSDRIETPLTFGSLRPVILFPQRMLANSTRDEQRFCLAHEWTHVRQRDIRTWHLITLSQPLLWCQPLFWHLRRELRVCQDLLADSAAAASGPEDYAELLLSLGKNNSSLPAGALGIGDQKSHLYRRITMLLDNTINTRTRCRAGVLAMSFAVCTAVAIVASFVSLDSSRAAQPDDGVTGEKSKDGDSPKLEPLSYSGIVTETDTGDAIEGAIVTVRRMIFNSIEKRVIEESHHTTNAQGKYSFVIPPEQRAERSLYIELDVYSDEHASRTRFGYALSMIVKNEKLGERPFFEKIDLLPAEHITGTLVSPDGSPVSDVKLLTYSQRDANDFIPYGSFFRATSRADGTFRLNVVKGGTSAFWIAPIDYAPQQIDIRTKRGDLGKIQLRTGVRLTGQVLDANDNPISGIWVNAENGNKWTDLIVAAGVCRSAMTDDQGRFTLGPLESGRYRVRPGEYPSDINHSSAGRALKPMPAVFGRKNISIDTSSDQKPIVLKAVPHITINAQFFNSKREPRRGHAFTVFSQEPGIWRNTSGIPDRTGKVVCMVPRIKKKTMIALYSNEHGALRYRMSKDEQLKPVPIHIELGTLDDDIDSMEIVLYTAPVVVVKAVDENQKLIEGVKVLATGSGERCHFVRQDDGRYRSSGMLPDEDITIKAAADGYEEASQMIKMIEGEEMERVLVLKKKA